MSLPHSGQTVFGFLFMAFLALLVFNLNSNTSARTHMIQDDS